MHNRYILLTAAKMRKPTSAKRSNRFCRQSVHPLAWFIIDDGSADQTAKIIAEFAARHPFIRLYSAGGKDGRNFGSQYKAITAAYDMAIQLDFQFLAVQDADIVPERTDYYESILAKFEQNPRLGIAGGYIYERSNGKWACRRGNLDSVAGGIQMFRRSCFEQIGGYTPLYIGGSDWLAQIDGAMAGWEVMAYRNSLYNIIAPHRLRTAACGDCFSWGYWMPLSALIRCLSS